MLGWGVMVWRDSIELGGTRAPIMAHWETGTSGLRWLHLLVDRGLARDLGGNGYPLHYRVRGDAFGQAIGRGLPSNSSPSVVGDDYVLSARFNGKLTLDAERFRQCAADEWLVLEAWDLS